MVCIFNFHCVTVQAENTRFQTKRGGASHGHLTLLGLCYFFFFFLCCTINLYCILQEKSPIKLCKKNRRKNPYRFWVAHIDKANIREYPIPSPTGIVRNIPPCIIQNSQSLTDSSHSVQNHRYPRVLGLACKIKIKKELCLSLSLCIMYAYE